MKRILAATALMPLLLATATSAAPPATLAKTGDGLTLSRPQTAVEQKALDYLISQQDPNGAWMPQAGPAVTAMVVRGLVQSGRPLTDPTVAKGLAFIEKFRQNDGGYYQDANPNYNTSIVLSLFSSLPGTAYQDKIAKAQAYLKSVQSIEGHKDKDGKEITRDHPWYGGAGYSTKRPDLSNTSYFLDALVDSGTKSDDPAIQKALVFVSRCQMNSETNDQPFAKGQSSGGFVYSTNAGGESMMGKEKERAGEEILVAYGSMTYAGLKSFLYAGLTKDDPRVKQAWKWITENWTLDVNPGTTSQQGLYYYYHTFAKALHVTGQDRIVDAKGVSHDWRQELQDKLASLQNPDGSFLNTKEARWMEGNPSLATSYVILTLQEARK